MKKTTDVLKGKIENMKRVATRTENSMVTFTVGGTPCKAFGKGAEIVCRWIQLDPNSSGEFEGYFEKHSEKFGKEFVAVHGRPIETERINFANGSEMAAAQTVAPGVALSSAPSAPVEPIPASSSTSHAVNQDEGSQRPTKPDQAKLDESMIAHWVSAMNSPIAAYSNRELKKRSDSPNKWVREAARRVLEQRRMDREAINQREEVMV